MQVAVQAEKSFVSGEGRMSVPASMFADQPASRSNTPASCKGLENKSLAAASSGSVLFSAAIQDTLASPPNLVNTETPGSHSMLKSISPHHDGKADQGGERKRAHSEEAVLTERVGEAMFHTDASGGVWKVPVATILDTYKDFSLPTNGPDMKCLFTAVNRRVGKQKMSGCDHRSDSRHASTTASAHVFPAGFHQALYVKPTVEKVDRAAQQSRVIKLRKTQSSK